LLDQGLRYDASLIPHRPQHFNCSPRPHLRKVSYSQKILELPVSALPLGRFSIPYCGGGYLRLMPRPLLHFLMKRQNRLGLPNTVYLHPRDFAVDCPHIKLSPLRHFRTYHGISSAILIMTNSCSIPEKTSTVRTSARPNRARTVETARVV
jgi:hypothetical protein